VGPPRQPPFPLPQVDSLISNLGSSDTGAVPPSRQSEAPAAEAPSRASPAGVSPGAPQPGDPMQAAHPNTDWNQVHTLVNNLRWQQQVESTQLQQPHLASLQAMPAAPPSGAPTEPPTTLAQAAASAAAPPGCWPHTAGAPSLQPVRFHGFSGGRPLVSVYPVGMAEAGPLLAGPGQRSCSSNNSLLQTSGQFSCHYLPLSYGPPTALPTAAEQARAERPSQPGSPPPAAPEAAGCDPAGAPQQLRVMAQPSPMELPSQFPCGGHLVPMYGSQGMQLQGALPPGASHVAPPYAYAAHDPAMLYAQQQMGGMAPMMHHHAQGGYVMPRQTYPGLPLGLNPGSMGGLQQSYSYPASAQIMGYGQADAAAVAARAGVPGSSMHTAALMSMA